MSETPEQFLARVREDDDLSPLSSLVLDLAKRVEVLGKYLDFCEIPESDAISELQSKAFQATDLSKWMEEDRV
jgi:hypothetical protein